MSQGEFRGLSRTDHLLCNHEDLGGSPSSHMRSAMGVHKSESPVLLEAEGRRIAGAITSESVNSTFAESPCLKNQVEVGSVGSHL